MRKVGGYKIDKYCPSEEHKGDAGVVEQRRNHGGSPRPSLPCSWLARVTARKLLSLCLVEVITHALLTSRGHYEKEKIMVVKVPNRY